MIVQEKVPISGLTTMRIGGNARYVVTLESKEDIDEVFNFVKKKNLPIWIMGNGANTIGRDAGFEGIILKNGIKGIQILAETENILTIKAMGGEVWDNVVEFVCQKGYSGIEAMSKIPGSVGAAPVQNIGAYGQDVARVLVEAEAYDIKEQKIVVIPVAEMGTGYRKTIFNSGKEAGRYFILAVTLTLSRNFMRPPFYNSLQKYIDENEITDYSPMNIRKIVSKIRAEKLPDPEYIASSGSFFKNIYLGQVEADEAEERGIPVWRTNDDSGKINSGWLIENAGFKGKLLHGMRVSEKATLVLINESAGSYQNLSKARTEIIEKVKEKFGFVLEQEPVEIPEK